MTDLPHHISGLTSSFSKDLSKEAFLADINQLVEPLQAKIEQQAPASPDKPVIFILGSPRSGTTLTSQVLAAARLFGTVNNFVARFWRAPAFGLLLARAFGLFDDPADSFVSTRGMTAGWSEPSEFGYFWSRYFDMGQSTHLLNEDQRNLFDPAGLRRTIAAMETVANRPMAFKNNTWFTFHADLLAEIFPGCVLVVCRRDPFFVAQSIWRQRLDLYGDPARWWSVRPPNFSEIVKLPPIEQVALQAISIQAEMNRALSNVRNAKIIEIEYSRLVSEPRRVVIEIAQAASLAPAEASIAKRLPARFRSTDIEVLSSDVSATLKMAIERFTAAQKLDEINGR